MVKTFLNKYKIVLVFLLFIILAFLAGFFSNNYFNGEKPWVEHLNVINNDLASSTQTIDMAPFWAAWKLLDQNYVPTGKAAISTTAQDRVWGAIQGMTASLGDPYTVFFPPTDNQDFETNISGNFEGVGMEIGIQDGVLAVVSPLKGSPAERAGIKAGDKIITLTVHRLPICRRTRQSV